MGGAFKTRTMNRVAIGALLAAVVLGLLCYMPMTAHASSKTTVNVITQEVKKTTPQEYTQETVKYVTKYSYNKVGLISKYNEKVTSSTGNVWKSGIKFKLDKKYRFVNGSYTTRQGEKGTQYYTLDKKFLYSD